MECTKPRARVVFSTQQLVEIVISHPWCCPWDRISSTHVSRVTCGHSWQHSFTPDTTGQWVVSLLHNIYTHSGYTASLITSSYPSIIERHSVVDISVCESEEINIEIAFWREFEVAINIHVYICAHYTVSSYQCALICTYVRCRVCLLQLIA